MVLMNRTTISNYVGVRMRAVRTTGARSEDNVLLLEDGSVTN